MRTRLYRSRTDRWVAGVCGGLGAYYGVDSNAVRLAFALVTLWNGMGALLYVFLVLLVPEEPLAGPATEPGLPPPKVSAEEEMHRRTRVLGMMAIVGGLFLLLRNFRLVAMLFDPRGVADIFAIVVMVAGILILLLRPRRL